VDSAGNLLTGPATDPAAWTVHAIDPGRLIEAVACGSPTPCVASDGAQLLTSTAPADANSWTPGSVGGAGKILALSCPSTSLCAAVDTTGTC
jgi:hypothetical protein